MIIVWTKGTYKQAQGSIGSGLAVSSHDAPVAAIIALIATVVALSLLTRPLALTVKERKLALEVLTRTLQMTLRDWQDIADTGFPYTFPFYFMDRAKILTLQDRTLQLNVKDRDG